MPRPRDRRRPGAVRPATRTIRPTAPAVISLGWVLFRAWDLYTFAGVIQGLAGQHGTTIGENSWSVAALPISLIIVLLALHPLDTLPRMRLVAMKLKRKPIIFATVIIGLWLLAITMGIDSSAEFIYFDF